MRISNSYNLCKRWYITFDGSECTPIPIDGIVYSNTNEDLHRTRSIIGHCKIQKRGPINVALNLGDCPGYTGGDAMTGWKSSTRIHVEEIEPPQQTNWNWNVFFKFSFLIKLQSKDMTYTLYLINNFYVFQSHLLSEIKKTIFSLIKN